MTYEEQLSAARFKAERDAARQEVSRLNDLLAERDEAAAWVREYGGLREMKNVFDEFCCYHAVFMDLCDRLGVKIPKGSPDASDGPCIVVAAERCDRVLDSRLMPSGMRWPRYEDGELVRIGSTAPFGRGGSMAVTGVELIDNGFILHGRLKETGKPCQDVYPVDQRVKRPQVLAADGEPLEVGQTVWMTEPPYSQHIVRDLHGGHANFVDAISADYPVSKLTHQRPVLDADGVPTKVVDTVHILGEPDEYTVTAVDTGFIEVEFHGSGLVFDEKGLTHTKPEQDSLERIEADAETLVYGAAQDAFHGLEFRDELRKGIGDIMRRCKELAGASE